MKTLEMRKILIEEKYLNKWIDGTWSWNEDGSLDVKGNIDILTYQVNKLPFKFNKVTGYFDCSGCGLQTLENCPEEVTGTFFCDGNKLRSLEHAPKKVNIFQCQRNPGRFTKEDVKKVCIAGEYIYNDL